MGSDIRWNYFTIKAPAQITLCVSGCGAGSLILFVRCAVCAVRCGACTACAVCGSLCAVYALFALYVLTKCKVFLNCTIVSTADDGATAIVEMTGRKNGDQNTAFTCTFYTYDHAALIRNMNPRNGISLFPNLVVKTRHGNILNPKNFLASLKERFHSSRLLVL